MRRNMRPPPREEGRIIIILPGKGDCMPASIGHDDVGPDDEWVSWSVLAEVKRDLDTTVAYGYRQKVVVSGAGAVLQQQQPGAGIAPHAHLHPVARLTFLSERSSSHRSHAYQCQVKQQRRINMAGHGSGALAGRRTWGWGLDPLKI